jgi:hypothetical protein
VRSYLEKKKHTKKRVGGVAQGVSPEFKPQYCKKKKERKKEKERNFYLKNALSFLLDPSQI